MYPTNQCKNCQFQVKADRNCQVLVIAQGAAQYYNLGPRPGDNNFTCGFFQYRKDLLK